MSSFAESTFIVDDPLSLAAFPGAAIAISRRVGLLDGRQTALTEENPVPQFPVLATKEGFGGGLAAVAGFASVSHGAP
jgi:hypothetical protein